MIVLDVVVELVVLGAVVEVAVEVPGVTVQLSDSLLLDMDVAVVFRP